MSALPAPLPAPPEASSPPEASPPPEAPAPLPARVRRVALTAFRSYAALDLAVDAPLVALVGDNGAGKTNLLEALSLFAPGRGLRRAHLADLAREGSGGRFAVALQVEGGLGPARLGTGAEPGEDGPARRCRVNGATATATAFSDHLRLVWLTPALDGLFTGSAGERRRFLDRLVLGVDPAHAARVGAMERAFRQRNRLLDDQRSAPSWLDAVERECAAGAVAVAAARGEAVARLSAIILATADDASPFPRAGLALEGRLEEELGVEPAAEVEEAYRLALRAARARDRAAGRALEGPGASDLAVTHLAKGVPAERASTGEQKALLIGLVLAQARLVAAHCGVAPLVLLDEVAAHLDPRRRAALFEALRALDAQVWMSGADRALFAELPGEAALVEVTPGAARLSV